MGERDAGRGLCEKGCRKGLKKRRRDRIVLKGCKEGTALKGCWNGL